MRRVVIHQTNPSLPYRYEVIRRGGTETVYITNAHLKP